MEPLECKICKKVFDRQILFTNHLKSIHNMNFIEHYDIHIKKDGDDLCKICGEKTYYSKELKKYSPLCKKHISGVSLEKLIIKYGNDIGTEKFNLYCEKQSTKNTYEFKKEKYGWTEDQFKKFNNSRAVTETNLVKKHGQEKGLEIFNKYREKQSFAGCKLEYFQEKYGLVEGELKYKEINFNKKHDLETYIVRYGSDELARIKLAEFYESREFGFCSKISQELFNNIIAAIDRKEYIYFKELNKEFGTMAEDGRYFFYDFVDTQTKTVIEFNGIKFHVKDEQKEFTQLYSGNSKEHVMERDSYKKSTIENRGYYVHYVWEDDYYNDKEIITQQCINLLKERHHDRNNG